MPISPMEPGKVTKEGIPKFGNRECPKNFNRYPKHPIINNMPKNLGRKFDLKTK